jgi:hypothetical protein
MYWPLILRGIGLGLLVPITTLSLSTLKVKILEGAALLEWCDSWRLIWYCNYNNIYNPIYTKHRVDLISNLDGSNLKFNNESCFAKGFYGQRIYCQWIIKKGIPNRLQCFKTKYCLSIYGYLFLYLNPILLCIPIVFSSNEDKIKLIPDAMH